jgi:hypothetical protein
MKGKKWYNTLIYGKYQALNTGLSSVWNSIIQFYGMQAFRAPDGRQPRKVKAKGFQIGNRRNFTMQKTNNKTTESRSGPRTFVEKYRSVEFSISKRDPIFQFRIRDVSSSGMGILLTGSSKALKHLEVGQILQMTYNPETGNGPPVQMKTEIRHITYLEDGRYKGQYLVGLAIKSETEADSQEEEGLNDSAPSFEQVLPLITYSPRIFTTAPSSA